MEFHDCNCFIGLPANGILRPVRTAGELLAQMDRSGISRGLVWHVAQRDYSAVAGNKLLADAIAGHADRLTGCWAILPTQTPELPGPDELFVQMAKANVRALRAFPRLHRYLLRGECVGKLLEQVVARRVPLMLSVNAACTWEDVYNILAEFPELTAIVCNVGSWGPDRLFRPLFERYPNVCMEISEYILDYGIEDAVRGYGARRLLYGSDFPAADHGGMMLALKHADISEDDKQAIAGGNLDRMLSEVRL